MRVKSEPREGRKERKEGSQKIKKYLAEEGGQNYKINHNNIRPMGEIRTSLVRGL